MNWPTSTTVKDWFINITNKDTPAPGHANGYDYGSFLVNKNRKGWVGSGDQEPDEHALIWKDGSR